MSTKVFYNGNEISPTPFVSREFSPIDIGQRWGYSESIKLDGVITGQQGTGKLNALTGLFSRSYKTLLIESPVGTTFDQIDNCILENISVGENRFALESSVAIPYSVSLRAFSNTSGVMDVSDSYSFSNNENGIISINHEVSARGVYDGNEPLDNAYSFVSLFTGRNPLLFVTPIFNQTGNPILKSVNEQIDRASAQYSVSETWDYETGSSSNFTTVSSLEISTDKTAEYPTASLSIEFNGPVSGSMSSLRNSVGSYNFYSKLSEFGVNTGAFLINSMSFEEKEPNSISASISYISGLSAEFTTGIFKNQISLDWDEITDIKTYSVTSDFVIKGPPQHRLDKIAQASNSIITGYRHYLAYLYNVVGSSALFSSFGDRGLNPIPESFSIKYNTTNPSFSLTASFNDSDFYTQSTTTLPNGLSYPVSIGATQYKLNFQPEVWLFDIQSAANIEGHFIVQDLNCKSRNKFSIDISTNHPRETIQNGNEVNPLVSYNKTLDILSGISNQIAAKSYETNQNINSGNYSHSIQKSFFANNCLDPRLSANKFYGFLASSYNTRGAGYKFGF